MEGPECCGSFSSTSSRTEVSTAVTIADQSQVIVGVRSSGQCAAPAPFLENVRLKFFPDNQSARLVLQFEDVTGLEAKLFSKFARNFDLAVLSYYRVHATTVRADESESRTRPSHESED